MMPSWLTGRWAVGIAAWVASSFAVWFAGDTLALGGWRPLDAPGERVAFIAALAAAWLGWELLRARRTLQENARLLDGLVGGIADQDSASRAAHEIQVLRKRFEDALGVLRKARFRCVMALAVPGGATLTVEGRLDGYITDRPRGEDGFGYDPVFLVPEVGKTLAEMGPNQKNALSHRFKALQAIRPTLLNLRKSILDSQQKNAL